MTKQEIILSIKNRIIAEYSKHPTLDWPNLAANKLYYAQVKTLMEKAFEAGRVARLGYYMEDHYFIFEIFEDYLKSLEDDS